MCEVKNSEDVKAVTKYLFGSGYSTDPCSKRAKSPTQYIFESSGKKLKSWGRNCRKLVAIFSKRWHVKQARRAWIPSWIPEAYNSNLSELSKCSISFIKTCLVFFRQSLILRFDDTWILIKWLACHMARRSQWRVAAIMTSLSWHHHHDVILWLHQDGGFTKTIGKKRGKKRPDFAINLHIFWFDFSKAINLY